MSSEQLKLLEWAAYMPEPVEASSFNPSPVLPFGYLSSTFLFIEISNQDTHKE